MKSGWIGVTGLTLLGLVDPAASQTAEAWKFRPSLYALAALDESSDIPFVDPSIAGVEPSAGVNLGFGLDFSRTGPGSLFRGAMFGLARNPTAGVRRSYFGAGRAEFSRPVGARWRVALSDAGRVQRFPHLDVSDFWANEASARVEWSRPSGQGVGLHLSDRRRALSELTPLGFDRQALGLSAFFHAGRRGRAEVGLEIQRFSAPTALGHRLVASGEWARFSRRGASSLRLAWFEPLATSRVTADPAGDVQSGGNSEYGDIGRGEFFESLALGGTDGTFVDESFFVDPLESETDEWDFGRRKQVVTALVSRRLGERSTISAFLRLQHRSGPDFLFPESSPSAGSFKDDRIALRITVRRDLGSRVSFLLHGAGLNSRSSRPAAAFSRSLVAFGVQIRF